MMKDSELSSTAGGVLIIESIFTSLFIGMFAKSWWVALVIFLILFFSVFMNKVAILLGVVFTIVWTCLLFYVGINFFESYGAAFFLGIIALIVSGLAHIGVLVNND